MHTLIAIADRAARLLFYGLILAAPLCGGVSSYLDRTTLTRLPSGEVRQVIETSSDEGRNRTTGFDAVNRRRHGPDPVACPR